MRPFPESAERPCAHASSAHEKVPCIGCLAACTVIRVFGPQCCCSGSPGTWAAVAVHQGMVELHVGILTCRAQGGARATDGKSQVDNAQAPIGVFNGGHVPGEAAATAAVAGEEHRQGDITVRIAPDRRLWISKEVIRVFADRLRRQPNRWLRALQRACTGAPNPQNEEQDQTGYR